MAKTKRKAARQQGAIPVGGTWEDIFWIQQRADHLRAWGQVYGVLTRAIADRFNRTYPPRRQTAENLAKFARRIRAAKSEWREVARMREAAREAARSKASDDADPPRSTEDE
jgi:Xaa-Pro aminopeptidase